MDNLVNEANAVFANDRFATKLCGANIESVYNQLIEH